MQEEPAGEGWSSRRSVYGMLNLGCSPVWCASVGSREQSGLRYNFGSHEHIGGI